MVAQCLFACVRLLFAHCVGRYRILFYNFHVHLQIRHVHARRRVCTARLRIDRANTCIHEYMHITTFAAKCVSIPRMEKGNSLAKSVGRP